MQPVPYRLRHTLTLIVLVALFAAFAPPRLAIAQPPASVEQGTLGGGRLLLDDGRGDPSPAPQLDTRAEIHVSGMTARVTLVQRFSNPGTGWVEGVYLFPLPEDAAVDRLTVQVGERRIEGEIRPREEAQAAYSAARDSGQVAGLIDQERPNLFTTSVANIAPGADVTVEIGYQETLRFERGSFSLRLPLAITPRYVPGLPIATDLANEAVFRPSGLGWASPTAEVPDADRITPPVLDPAGTMSADGPTVSVEVRLEAGFALAELTSLNHAVTRSDEGAAVHLELAEVNVPADRDFVLRWRPDPGASPEAAAFTERLGGHDYALLMLLPPSTSAAGSTAPPREMILVIDTSGSMAGVSIEQAKEALGLALDRLRPQDRFNLIAFDDHTVRLFDTSQPASRAALDRARRFVRRLQADGGTEMAPALDLALAGRAPAGALRQIVFITDGSVGNEAALFGRIARGLGRSRLFTVGIGAAPNSYFMRKAAEFGRGRYTFIDDVSAVERRMSELFETLEQPLVTDLEIDFPAGTVAYPATVRDLYAGEPVVVHLRLPTLAAGADTEVVLRGRLEGRSWTRRLRLAPDDPAVAPGAPTRTASPEAGVSFETGVAQLWARAAIEAHEDEQILGADPAEVRTRVEAIALEHRLVSAYTSLVAIDRTPIRPGGEPLETQAVPLALPAGGVYEAIFGYPSTATPAALRLLAGAVLLTCAFGLLVVRRSRGAVQRGQP